MNLFPILNTDDLILTGEKTRLDCSRSFANGAETFEVTVKPSPSSDFLATSSDLHLDWVFSTPGDHTVEVKMESGVDSETISKTVKVTNVADLKLFSKDSDLLPFEPDIRGYIPPQWSSFNLIHKRAQDIILNALDEARVYDADGKRLEADQIADVLEVKDWSVALTLRLIFEGISNQVGDVFSEKAQKYGSMAIARGNKASFRLDPKKDDNIENRDVFSGVMVRR